MCHICGSWDALALRFVAHLLCISRDVIIKSSVLAYMDAKSQLENRIFDIPFRLIKVGFCVHYYPARVSLGEKKIRMSVISNAIQNRCCCQRCVEKHDLLMLQECYSTCKAIGAAPFIKLFSVWCVGWQVNALHRFYVEYGSKYCLVFCQVGLRFSGCHLVNRRSDRLTLHQS